jgi:hypothetical protein
MGEVDDQPADEVYGRCIVQTVVFGRNSLSQKWLQLLVLKVHSFFELTAYGRESAPRKRIKELCGTMNQRCNQRWCKELRLKYHTPYCAPTMHNPAPSPSQRGWADHICFLVSLYTPNTQ